MKKIMNILMLSCNKATELMEKELHFRLNVFEKIQLRLHTSMCNACNTYQKNNKLVDDALKAHISSTEKRLNFGDVALSDEFKKALIKDLEED
jgi:hypothetical protein